MKEELLNVFKDFHEHGRFVNSLNDLFLVFS